MSILEDVRAACAGISSSNPFPPLPPQFGGKYLALRFYFYYNPDKNDLQQSSVRPKSKFGF